MTMELMDYKTKGIQAVLVALTNNEVHTYLEKNLVDVMPVEDTVTGMKFGKFGREDSSLIMAAKGADQKSDYYIILLFIILAGNTFILLCEPIPQQTLLANNITAANVVASYYYITLVINSPLRHRLLELDELE